MLHCDDVCIDDDHYLSYMQWMGMVVVNACAQN